MAKKAKETPPEEEAARRLVENRLGTLVEESDDGSKPSLPDLMLGSPVYGVGEVTTLSDGAAVSVMKRVERELCSRQGSGRLSYPWVVMFSLPNDFGDTLRTTEFRGMARHIEELLRELELRGEHSMTRWSPHVQQPFHDASCPSYALARLGVSSASALPTTAAPSAGVYMSLAHGYTCHGPDEFVAAIEETLHHKPDNWEKLRVYDVEERHLFAWAGWSSEGVARSLEWDELPNRPPRIEQYGLTDVWAGVYGQWQRAVHWSRATDWENVIIDINDLSPS